MVFLKLNGFEFTVKEDISVLEACKFVGIKIPRFCYHETLSIAGNCRMCLVRTVKTDIILNNSLIDKNVDLDYLKTINAKFNHQFLKKDIEVEEEEAKEDIFIISCLTPVESNMSIVSNDPIIKKIREEIIEFLLLNHPLDCPICDQGGECDLQDQTKAFGSIRSKFISNKVGVEDKNFGFFIKSVMTRCIHCTRCVRFSSEIAGVDFFGTLNRGGNTEIGLYSNSSFFNSEISGNVIDLCPVGALTSKPYTFKARPWELKSLETLDLTDGVGSNTYTHFSESEILRIIPKYNSEINNSIISDKARFIYDVGNFEKLNSNIDTILKINKIKNIVKKEKLLILISEEINFESLNLLKKAENSYPNIRIRYLNNKSYLLEKSNVFLNEAVSIKTIETSKSSIFMVATNPKIEASIINARIRSLTLLDYFQVYSLGFKFESNLKDSFLNFNINEFILFIEGKSKALSSLFIHSYRPLFIINSSLSTRGFDFLKIKSFLNSVNPSLVFIKIETYNNSGITNYINFKSVNTNDIRNYNNFLFLNCKESNFVKKVCFKYKNTNIFWLNPFSFSSTFKKVNTLISKNIYEETGTYFNLEFRPQISYKIFKNTNKYSLFDILIELFSFSNVKYNYNSFISEFLQSSELFEENTYKPYLFNILKLVKKNNRLMLLKDFKLKPEVSDFFKGSFLTEKSKNMLNAARHFRIKNSNFF